MSEQHQEMSFLQHLEVLRWHLLRSAIAILAGAALSLSFKHILFDIIIMAPKSPGFITNVLLCQLSDKVDFINICINQKDWTLQNFQMVGQFLTHLKISLIAGLILASPYVLWEVWRFIKPALKERERKYSALFISTASLLLLTGVCFGYFILAPISINFFINYSVSDQVQNIPLLSSYIALVTSIPLACGVVFELPLIIYFLTRLGVISVQMLKKYRRHAFIVLLTLSAMITPPDVFSQILICIPLTGLYEIGIIVAKRVEKKQQKKV